LEALLGYLFIFCARVCDVSLGTVRMLMTMRGQRVQAAIIGFFEVLIFITALGQVMLHLDNWANLVAYALGFATGTLTGALLEEKLALGFLTVQVVLAHGEAGQLVDELRQKGFGVTVVDGEGRDGPRQILFVSVRRRHVGALLKLLREHEPEAFVTTFEPRRVLGGVFAYRKGK
jgi:uncharacterized protein YebE (UPF0316 family)